VFESSPLNILAIAWAVVTAVYFGLVYVRSLVALKENDTLILSAGEAKLEAEQHALQNRLNRLTPYTRIFGWLSVGLLVVLAGMWVYDASKELLK
jgi:hypothetical protein